MKHLAELRSGIGIAHRCVFTALIICTATLAQAQLLPEFAAHFKINKVDISVDVGAKYLTRVESYFERQALTEHGSVLIGKYALGYDNELETLEIVEAYTLKPDGQKISVGPEGVQRQSGVASDGYSASWPTRDVLQLTFPNVQIRDRTVVRLVQTTLALPLDGWYSIQSYLPPTIEYENFHFRLSAPPEFGIRVSGAAFESTQLELINGKVVWNIVGSSAPKSMDANAIDVLQVWPHIVGSSLLSHEEVMHAYAAKNNVKARVNADTQKLADSITKGAIEPQAKARALYDWVRTNIRYVAIYLGAGGWVPHDVDWILKSRYGDCKDKALLLQVLLKAAGIEAVPVLINTNTQYVLPELPVADISFNHVVVYVPALNLYMDPTATNTPFGELPWPDQDKPVAVALPEGAMVMRTPVTKAGQNVISSKAKWRIEASGNASLDLKISATGLAAIEMQDRLQRIPTGMATIAVQKVIEESGFKGRGFVQYPGVQRDVLEQTVAMQLDLRDVLADKEAGAINPNPELSALPIYVRSQYSYATVAREYAITCTPLTTHEEFELAFDPTFKIVRIPSNLELDSENGVHFSASYKLAGQIITGSRTLTSAHESNSCSPAVYAKRKPTFDLITQHLRSNVIYSH